MRTDDSTTTPLSDENVYVAFLKDFESATDPEQVVGEYAQRYPHLAGELRAMAGMRRTLDRSAPADEGEESQPERLGDFRIVGRIAHGGMGAIYEAIQEPLGRRVAVKIIRGHHRHLTGMLQGRFLREQKVLAQLHHTHIVPIHAAGLDGALQYFAMSYIDGAALHHVVRTAQLHEWSSARGQTPTLAVLAAEAQSRLSGESQLAGEDKAPANGHPEQPAADVRSPSADSLGEPSRVDPKPETELAPALSGTGNGKLVLSPEYFRSVARVMIDAAEALQHAHEAGIIHRDLKPSNLMVDTAEHCWVLDFGLAGYLKAQANGHAHDGPPAPEAKPAIDLGPEPNPPTMSGVVGTPHYMAPEQFQGRADARADVWGLGVILYELLTLRRAFQGQKEIESPDPPRPRDLVHDLPLDLDAICWKTIRKEPAQRYPAARALADDLRHWLKSEPVQARPAHTLRRVLLWVKRNKGWAAAIALATLAFVAVSAAAIYVNKTQADAARAVALAAGEKQHEAEERAAAEHREAQTQQREALIQQMQRVRLTYQRESWSTGAWDLARRAATIERDPRIQAEAATLLAGIDVRRVKSLALPGTALAFNPSGKRLMIGGSNPLRRETDRPVQVWDSTTDQAQPTQVTGEGVFGFRADGTPLLLKVPGTDRSKAQLWDVIKAQVLHEFKSPLESKSAIRGFALTPDGTLVAASARALDEKGEPDAVGVIAVWEAASGREIFRSASQGVTEVALAPDASLLAAGHEDGEITVWSLPKGEPIATLKADRNRINCLVFGRDPFRRAGPRRPGSTWLLAAGDNGGGVIVWDLRMRIPRSICHGPTSSSEVLALALSPDRMTLASSGRGFVQLWDIASGQFLLNVGAGNYVTALSFSPDGRRLAVGSIGAFGWPDSVDVWELEPGRGIESLRGLSGFVLTSIVSLEGRMVAALSNDWHVGIWDRSAHRLLHVLEVTPGFFLDNAALAFRLDGRQLAYTAGREASLWDVATGEAIKTWRLPAGLVDQMAFTESNRLLVFREETETCEVGPFRNFDARKYPRVCRVRDLLGHEPLKPLAEIRDCNLHVFHAACSPDGRYYVVEGKGGAVGRETRIANLYEGPTGKKLGTLPSQSPPNWDSASFKFDTTGTVLSFVSFTKELRTFLLEMPSRAVLRQFDEVPQCLGPRARRWLMDSAATGDQPRALTLFEEDRQEPLIKFVLDLGNNLGTGKPQFSPDGLHLVWGTSGGVTVVDLVEVNRRLSELGLGW
ncbi:MAG: WD40 repeat domain-containing serine/threonine protein kinase [Isosphaerales bacterium]